MATKEDDFKQRFVAVLQDLRANGNQDPEALFLIGSLAARLLDEARQPDWGAYKARMAQPAYAKLLADLQRQGNEFHQQGKPKHAYAIQVLAISLIARTQSDKDVRAGDSLLDGMLDFLIAAYRKAQQADPKPN